MVESVSMSLSRFLNTLSTTANSVGQIFDNGQRLVNNVNNIINDFSTPWRILTGRRTSSIPFGAESPTQTFTTGTWISDQSDDWRVRISIPPLSQFESSPILAPLRLSNNSMVWPLTPQVMINHSASYNSMTPTHTNYPFPVYQNSQVEDITISGDFPVENEEDGRYWIAAVHFMRSITKMFYGQSSLNGTPPPITRLNGYGGFVFKDLPVVVKLFTMDLPNGVDYIKVPVSGSGTVDLSVGTTTINSSGNFVYVPTLSMMSVTLGIAPSRDDVRQFSLDRFVRGDYISEGKFI
jgi:hypothetical protein